EFLRAQHYAAMGELVEVERPTTSPNSGNGECDLLLTGNRLIDCKAWTASMWRDASEPKRIGMINSLKLEIAKYLEDPTGYTLRLEFHYLIPPRVLAELAAFLAANPGYATRLTMAPSQV